ncbi:hypothetical protein [uncultured Photobacterium sp.]|uniref:hypothetical protein n=1 Tax=uncultured Photobacterium sp. TaxID=173973 RepID=UPI002621C880|nr:hypothetical protein [uncultured Photobacterium sp.]
MSKVKNPQEKKCKSYEKDCRNVYGENDKSSRKSIRRNKQLASKLSRSSSSNLALLANHDLDEDFVLEVESNIKASEKVKRLKGFKKVPDRPLGGYLANKSK